MSDTETHLKLAVESAETTLLACQSALASYQGESGEQPTEPTEPPPEETPPSIPPPEEEVDERPPFNSAAFFDVCREQLFGGSLNQGQVDGINIIGNACFYFNLNNWIFQTAYVLATTYHETAQTMQPIEEYGGSNTRYAPWYGRGYVQLTWEENYQKQQDKMSEYSETLEQHSIPWKVHDDWNLALHQYTSAIITVGGMQDGDFTGKKLDDYNIAGDAGVADYDYVEARRIVNGTDRASQIAGYARSFEAAIRTGLTVPAE